MPRAFLALSVLFAVPALVPGCLPSSSRPLSLDIDRWTVEIAGSHARSLDADYISFVERDCASRTQALDPHDGNILGRLNDSEVGEIVPAEPVLGDLEDILEHTRTCFGAFDPTLQILWDVYEFEDGGRYVSDVELADALRWVDYRNIEISRGGILRKTENTRFGLGPVTPALILDWVVQAVETRMPSGRAQIRQFLAVWGEGQEYVYDIKYPLEPPRETTVQLSLGHIRLLPEDRLAAMDDDEMYFFAHGEQYHMVLSPITGKPVRSVRAAVVISRESCLQAAICSYAVMVMGPDRGMEFLDETEGVSGVILSENHEVSVSGDLAERFWR